MYKRAAEQNCLALLDLCNSFSTLTQIQARILKLGHRNNLLILSKFTSIASGIDAIDYSCSFTFSPESEPHYNDTFLFNTVIEAYAGTTHSKPTALQFYRKMLSYGVSPNNYTYPFVLKACAGIRDFILGKTIHGPVLKLGFCANTHVTNAMIHMYSSCENGFESAQKVFDEMPEKNSVSWSTMIGGCVRCGKSSQAIELFRRMQMIGLKPNVVTMVMVLSACADSGALELGRWIESFIKKEKFEMRTELCNALIDMYAKCGDLDCALGLFTKMPTSQRTVVSWTCVIFGMAAHGRALEAVSRFEEMKRARVDPDDVTFIGLLTACRHAGLVEEGKRYFRLMVDEYGIGPRMEHYGCMVDLLGRAGLVREALEFVERMPVVPSPVIWRTLVSACRAQDKLSLGQKITMDLIKKEPMQDVNYVLLSSIYAKMANWGKKDKVRGAMAKRGVRKASGSAVIELGGGD
ncbi:pentatricopeptide repeat-containing protein [Striga asiatica]|uniref:Pentatricopeptide repeat-containing protein n=1 Tax=Striga asiatica TaxID=4170 RepID=A0A5A7PII4_STRAF|nr:pentatricopeptide repeat-containing protein [Striga asiatica]